MATIAITGGSGRIATWVRPLLLEAGHDLRLLDVVTPPGDLRRRETFEHVGVTDLDSLTVAFSGADLVVHLASHASERTWHEIRDLNVESAYVVHEAARRAGVTRLLAASSVHAVGFEPGSSAADHDVPAPRPDSFYGVSKVLLEAVGSLYADRFGSTVVSARIMTAEVEPHDVRSLGTWLSPADATRLILATLSTAPSGHHVVWGVSRNTRRVVSLAAGEAIGYHPEDDAEAFADRFAGQVQPPDAPVGGTFTTMPLGEAW